MLMGLMRVEKATCNGLGARYLDAIFSMILIYLMHARNIDQRVLIRIRWQELHLIAIIFKLYKLGLQRNVIIVWSISHRRL